MGAVLAGLQDLFPDNGTILGEIGKALNLGYLPSEYLLNNVTIPSLQFYNNSYCI
jgi:hypothetical protein